MFFQWCCTSGTEIYVLFCASIQDLVVNKNEREGLGTKTTPSILLLHTFIREVVLCIKNEVDKTDLNGMLANSCGAMVVGSIKLTIQHPWNVKVVLLERISGESCAELLQCYTPLPEFSWVESI